MPRRHCYNAFTGRSIFNCCWKKCKAATIIILLLLLLLLLLIIIIIIIIITYYAIRQPRHYTINSDKIQMIKQMNK